MVKATKRSLRYLPTSSLTLLELDAAIKNIASTINNHSLGINVNKDDVLILIQLLLGRNFNPIHPPKPVLESNITVLLPHVRVIVSSWFIRWNNISFPSSSRSPSGRQVILTSRRGTYAFCTRTRGNVALRATNITVFTGLFLQKGTAKFAWWRLNFTTPPKKNQS